MQTNGAKVYEAINSKEQVSQTPKRADVANEQMDGSKLFGSKWLQPTQLLVTVVVGIFAILGPFSLLASAIGIQYKRSFYSVLQRPYVFNPLLSIDYTIIGWLELTAPAIISVVTILVGWALVELATLVFERMYNFWRLLFLIVTFILGILHWYLVRQGLFVAIIPPWLEIACWGGLTLTLWYIFLPRIYRQINRRISFRRPNWLSKPLSRSLAFFRKYPVFRKVDQSMKNDIKARFERAFRLWVSTLFLLAVAISILEVIQATITGVDEKATDAGEKTLEKVPHPVRVIAIEPLLLDEVQPKGTSVGATDVLVYEPLHLLCSDGESYFIKNLASQTNSEHIYAIPTDQVEVVPLQATPLDLQCPMAQD